MITDERTAAYIDSLAVPKQPFLEELEKKAREEGVPIIRQSAQGFLRFVIAEKKPERILEIGTAVAFSALFMDSCKEGGLHIDTIENYEKHIEAAKKNIEAAGAKDRITLIEGDAAEVILKLAEEGRSYDMIFMDGAKAQYVSYLPVCKKLLTDGGVLVADNVLFDGDIVLSRFAVRRRDRTIHSRMRQFLRQISEDDELVSVILPIGDGMTCSVYKGKNSEGTDDR